VLEPRAPRRPGLLARLGLGRPELRAWALYDWGHSAFSTTVVTAVFPVYFARMAEVAGLSAAQSTSRFALATTVALSLTALLSVPLGVLADRRPLKKTLLAVFLALGSACTAALACVPPQNWPLALVLFGAANIGAAASFVFYDALLPHVAGPAELDRVSTAGYALGYAGGGLLLALNLLWILQPGWFGFADAGAASRASLASVALWWVVFSLPLLRGVREPAVRVARAELAPASLRELWRELGRRPQARLFLLAFLIYNDGIGTIIRMATTYGSELGIDAGALIGAVLLVQFIGIPASFAFGQLAERVGAKAGLFLALAVYGAVSGVAYFMQTAAHFFALAALIGLVQGGAQALSRSLFSSLIPRERSAEFFSLFAIFEKFTAILGPAVFSGLLLVSGSSRGALLSIASFFVVGALLLARVDVEAGRREAASPPA
jgi:UMF1 family MFS transporter